MCVTAGAWNFGLCATRSREPRQARKGATVPGLPRVPQITRSSSRRGRRKTLKRFSCLSVRCVTECSCAVDYQLSAVDFCHPSCETSLYELSGYCAEVATADI